MILPTSRAGRWALLAVAVAAIAVPWVVPARGIPQWRWLGRDAVQWTIVRYRLTSDTRRSPALGVRARVEEPEIENTLRVLREALDREDLRDVEIERVERVLFDLWIPPEVEVEHARHSLGSLPTAAELGDLAFRIEVRPAYAPFISPNGDSRTRERVWEGAIGSTPAETFGDTTEGFDRFKAREVERWKAARDAGESYVPLDARYRVVPWYRAGDAPPANSAADFAVVEEPTNPRRRLGGEIVENARPSSDNSGSHAVAFDIKPDFRGEFRAWTTKNVGLPMAIILNGEYDQAPVINGPLEDSVVVSLGGRSDPSAPDAAESLELQFKRQLELLRVLKNGIVPNTTPLDLAPVEENTTVRERAPAGLALARAAASVLLVLGLFVILVVSRWIDRPPKSASPTRTEEPAS